jgi:phage terminase small subunit
LEKMRRSTTNAAIASREERQSFWSSVLRDQNIDMKDRLKASDLLGKSQADFITRTEVSGPAGGPIKIDLAALTDDQLAALESVASALIPSS